MTEPSWYLASQVLKAHQAGIPYELETVNMFLGRELSQEQFDNCLKILMPHKFQPKPVAAANESLDDLIGNA